MEIKQVSPENAAQSVAVSLTPLPAPEETLCQHSDSFSEGCDETGNRVQVGFRMDRDAHRELKRMALDEGVTLGELIVGAVNEVRTRKGLPKLSG